MERFIGMANRVVSALVRRGVNLGSTVLLRVAGRKSGEPRTTPVTVLKSGVARYIQSPYGDTDWVLNLRASGRAKLVGKGAVEEFHATELTAEEAAPIYMDHIDTFPRPVRIQYEIAPEASLDDFITMARDHPMFRIDP